MRTITRYILTELICWFVAWLGVLTLLFLTQFPGISTDTNPKHMLPETSDVRVWNDRVDRTFGLYEDTIVVGVENDAGVLNRAIAGPATACI